MKKTGTFYCGTSNITIPGNKQSFPEAYRQRSRLAYYSSLFNSLEVNSSFYKVPQSKTFERWTNEVSAGFKFTIKLWKEITHVKELKFSEKNVEYFMNAANALGAHKGCLLIQFPGSITADYFTKVERILNTIDSCEGAKDWRKAIEFRHNSWYHNEVESMVDEFEGSIVLHDIPKSANWQLRNKSGFAFFRFHGEAGDYRGSYPKKVLMERSKMMKELMKKNIDVYAYFNNTIGDAFDNARTLQALIGKPK